MAATTSTSSTPPPALKYSIKSGKAGVRTYLGPAKLGAVDDALSDAAATVFEYSKDGHLLAVVTPTEISIRVTETGAVQAKIERRGVSHIAFSPQGSFLLTWEHLPKEIPEDQRKTYGNLCVWNTKTGEEVAHFIQKAFMKENWPSLRWSDDEVICGRMVSNEVQFYAGKIGQVVRTIKLPSVASFAVSPGPAPYKIATFVPEVKGQPAFVRIYKYPETQTHVAHKSFFKAQNVELMWNSDASAVLIGSHTDVDRTGKSYYGEDSLYYMTTEGKFENIVLPKEGPIHETSWSPNGKEFIVVYGFMPAQATLFGLDCKPKCDFGAAPRNTVKWDPFGRLVCIAGFGNLQGQMDFWDVKKLKKIGSATAHCAAHFEWAADGLHVLTAVLSPRIRVDNGYKVWRCDGTLLHEEAVDELLKVGWRKVAPGVFSAPRIPKPDPAAANSPTPSSSSSSSAAPQPAAPAKYRHPNFSGRSISVREESKGPVKYNAAKAAPAKNTPPGFYESKTASKNKKKRQNKKKGAKGEGNSANEKTEEEGEEEQSAAPESEAEIEKKVKALKKKLRQITLLKESQASGKTLDAAQLEKVNGEAKLLQEVAKLEASKPSA